MAELRGVDPRTLQTNPNNPRGRPVPPAMDEQLLASINTIGIIHPPSLTPNDHRLMILPGRRPVNAPNQRDLAGPHPPGLGAGGATVRFADKVCLRSSARIMILCTDSTNGKLIFECSMLRKSRPFRACRFPIRS